MCITIVINSQTRNFYKPAIHQLTADSFLSKLSIADFIFQNLDIHTFYCGICNFKTFNFNIFRHFGASLNIKAKVLIEINNSVDAVAYRVNSYSLQRNLLILANDKSLRCPRQSCVEVPRELVTFLGRTIL